MIPKNIAYATCHCELGKTVNSIHGTHEVRGEFVTGTGPVGCGWRVSTYDAEIGQEKKLGYPSGDSDGEQEGSLGCQLTTKDSRLLR